MSWQLESAHPSGTPALRTLALSLVIVVDPGGPCVAVDARYRETRGKREASLGRGPRLVRPTNTQRAAASQKCASG